MKYQCGTDVMLEDEIMAQHGPENEALARMVAIGTDLVSTDIDSTFYSCAKAESIIDANTIAIEWIEENPLSHNAPQYAPVGDYMTLQSICCERFIKRKNDGNFNQSEQDNPITRP